MNSPLSARTFAAINGFIPLIDAELSQTKTLPQSQPRISNPTESGAKATESEDTPIKRPKHFAIIFSALAFTEFARTIDAAVLPVILPGIVRDLHATTNEGFLSGSVFLLFQTISSPIYAGLAPAIGTKPLYLGSIILFAVSSVLAAVAKTPLWLIFARAGQGGGAGGLDVMAGIITSYTVPLVERGKYDG
jgi:MFS family permease